MHVSVKYLLCFRLCLITKKRFLDGMLVSSGFVFIF